ncbi:DUF3617 domain-containing protein [Sphingomonas sp. M1-B02]|uniref:DUF3617 domain-containing protein n=1 Tax=Sphingomonas sp. M1-B02 TaxID=3114300 RepID=UPI00223F2312|nr:DUF3617 domain-containing protein [Sphingomonas sp. S6-11]UZK65753.1 DUF3617 domain-containing protein [Sphingomonas sp. S6-11]
MNRLTIALPALAMLAGCNAEPTIKAENASIADVAAAAKDAIKLEPGKWETKIALLSLDGPGLPPEIATSMKQQMQEQTVETCLTPEQVKTPPQDMFGAAKNCTYEKFEMTAGKMDGTLLCKNAPGTPSGEMRIAVSGTFASTSYEVTSEAAMTMPPMPGGPAAGGKVAMKTRVVGKRLGDCDAPKAG